MPNPPRTSQKKRRQRRRKQQNQLNPTSPPIQSGRTTAPVAKNRTTKNAAPRFKQTREGCIISHREYITDITRAASTFIVDTFNVNAGLVSTFPWLSQVASRFESYTFERLDYVYEPMVSTATTGSLMMAVDFDASDTAPSNKVTLMSYAGATRSTMWQPTKLVCSAIDRKKMVPERYVRSGAIGGSGDIKTYDLGNLFVATVGTGGVANTFGELYVEYTVRLRTPQIQTNPGLNLSGRRATQQGQFTVNAAGVVQGHIANITGEGNQPIMQILDKFIRIDPRLKRCLLSITATPTTNWRNAFTTCLGNLRLSSNAPGDLSSLRFYGDPNSTSPINQGYGAARPQYAHAASVQSGTTQTLIETLIFGELDEEIAKNNNRFGTGLTSLPIAIRDDLVNTGGIVTFNYTLTPLDAEIWPKTTAPMLGVIPGHGAGTNQENIAVTWPTFDSATPGRSYTLEDGIQTFTFNSKQPLPEKAFEKKK